NLPMYTVPERKTCWQTRHPRRVEARSSNLEEQVVPAAIMIHGDEPMITRFNLGLAWISPRQHTRNLLTLETLLVLLLFVGLFLVISAGATLSAHAASEIVCAARARGAEADMSAAIPEQAEPGLSQKAVEIGDLFGFPVSYSIMGRWIYAVGLIVFAHFAT